MAELTDEEVIDAMQGASQRMTYVVANILRMTHKHHNGTLGTAKVLRRLKALEKRGVVERVRSDYAVQICWRLTHNAALTERDDGSRNEAADHIESLLAENERLKHNLTSTEQTMREYQELAAKRLEEIAKYRDAPVAAYGVLEDLGGSVISWDAIAGWPEAAHEHINDAIQIWKYSGDFVPKYSVVPLIVKPGEEK